MSKLQSAAQPRSAKSETVGFDCRYELDEQGSVPVRWNRIITNMSSAVQKIGSSPVGVRVAPFIVFVLLTSVQGKLGPTSQYWCYALKTIIGGWLLWQWRRQITEMRWNWSGPAFVVGIGVFVMWVGIGDFLRSVGLRESYYQFGRASNGWNPPLTFGVGSFAAWFFISIRLLGSTIVVPPLEEVFYRSFVYRYIAKPDFQSVPLGQFLWGPFLITSALFGLSHFEWLAGILCGFAYQGLVCWKKRLGDAMAAHAITNFLLALWVVWRGEWHFW